MKIIMVSDVEMEPLAFYAKLDALVKKIKNPVILTWGNEGLMVKNIHWWCFDRMKTYEVHHSDLELFQSAKSFVVFKRTGKRLDKMLNALLERAKKKKGIQVRVIEMPKKGK